MRLLTLALFLLTAISASAADAFEKWIYRSTNLLVEKNVDELGTLMARAKAAGYTHLLLADSKFARLGEMGPPYFRNVQRVKALAQQNGIQIVPAVFSVGYSNDLLSLDPNLVEALPVKNLPLLVKGGVAVVDDPAAPTLQ